MIRYHLVFLTIWNHDEKNIFDNASVQLETTNHVLLMSPRRYDTPAAPVTHPSLLTSLEIWNKYLAAHLCQEWKRIHREELGKPFLCVPAGKPFLCVPALYRIKWEPERDVPQLCSGCNPIGGLMCVNRILNLGHLGTYSAFHLNWEVRISVFPVENVNWNPEVRFGTGKVRWTSPNPTSESTMAFRVRKSDFRGHWKFKRNAPIDMLPNWAIHMTTCYHANCIWQENPT